VAVRAKKTGKKKKLDRKGSRVVSNSGAVDSIVLTIEPTIGHPAILA
jgi:hypothetical protein